MNQKTKASRIFLFMTLFDTLFKKSIKDLNSPFCSLSDNKSNTEFSPIFLIALKP